VSVVLSEHLPLLATAPEGIQKLRGLILELAVRGKLVPQDPNDEPASELLKRITKERTRLEAEGACKKSKPRQVVSEDEQPFAVPGGWAWVRLADIGHDWGQKTPDSDFTYVDVSAIDNARGVIDSPSVLAPENAPSRARKIVQRGTVIYSTVRPYLLNIAVIDRDLNPPSIASTAFAIVHPLAGLSSQYIFWYLRSPVFVRYVESVQTGIAYPAVNDAQFFVGLFPLPPLAEQHRIVAKVDKLMALCDRLEAEQSDAATAHERLAATLLGTLTQSADAADLAANWQRLAEHFDTLFTTEVSLDALKQTILQLAVMGKLVPQDPNDEPASELLKRIAKEKDRLMLVEGLRTTASDQIPANDCYMDIPGSWEFQRLGNLAKFIDYRGRTPDKISSGVPLITAKNVRFGFIGRDPREFVSEKEYADWMTRGFPRIGDILFTTEAPLGNVAIVDMEEKFALAQRVICFQFHEPQMASYLRLALMSEQVRRQIGSEATGMTATGIKAARLKEIPVPIPPLSEQHRIVAKVDELLALVDRLKADLAESRAQQERLATTLIESALKAA